MRDMLFFCFISISLLLLPASNLGQEKRDEAELMRQLGMQELEAIIAESYDLANKLFQVKARAKAAELLWRQDPERARSMLNGLWKWIGEQEAKTINIDEARAAVIKAAFARDAKMASGFLEEQLKAHKSEETSFKERMSGKDPNLKQLNRLSSEMIEQDSPTAAVLLQRSLSVSISPAAIVSLFRLREKNPTLADYIASQTLDTLRARPTLIALSGLFSLVDYLFPSQLTFAESFSQQPDDSLRIRFFSTAYDVLKTSIAESTDFLKKEQGYTGSDFRMRDVYQGNIAVVLAALAPMHAPELAGELNEISMKLSPNIPPNIAQAMRHTASRISGKPPDDKEDAQMAISVAMSKGDIAEANRLLDRIEDETARKSFAQMVASVEFRQYLAKSNISEAMVAVRRIDDSNLRTIMYTQAARAAYKKGEAEFSKLILIEARADLLKSDCNGLRARALLLLVPEVSAASPSDLIESLLDAVSCANQMARGLATKSGVWHKINDIRSLVDAPELRRAFSTAGATDFEGTLLIANGFEDAGIKLTARLAACEGLLVKTERMVKTSSPKAVQKK